VLEKEHPISLHPRLSRYPKKKKGSNHEIHRLHSAEHRGIGTSGGRPFRKNTRRARPSRPRSPPSLEKRRSKSEFLERILMPVKSDQGWKRKRGFRLGSEQEERSFHWCLRRDTKKKRKGPWRPLQVYWGETRTKRERNSILAFECHNPQRLNREWKRQP